MNPETIKFAEKLAEGARAKALENYIRLLALRRAFSNQPEAAKASTR